MQVVKRSGKKESVSFDKITARVKKLCYGLNQNYIEPIEIAKKVVQDYTMEYLLQNWIIWLPKRLLQ